MPWIRSANSPAAAWRSSVAATDGRPIVHVVRSHRPRSPAIGPSRARSAASMPTRTSSPDGVRPGPRPISPRAASSAAGRLPANRAARSASTRPAGPSDGASCNSLGRTRPEERAQTARDGPIAGRPPRRLAAGDATGRRPGTAHRRDMPAAATNGQPPRGQSRARWPGRRPTCPSRRPPIPRLRPSARKSGPRSTRIPFGRPPSRGAARHSSPSGDRDIDHGPVDAVDPGGGRRPATIRRATASLRPVAAWRTGRPGCQHLRTSYGQSLRPVTVRYPH